MGKSNIHPLAVIESGAKIGEGVTVEPFAIIKQNVVLEDNVTIKSHVYVDGNTTIGNGTTIWPFASIGTKTQDLKFRGEKTFVKGTVQEIIPINKEGAMTLTTAKYYTPSEISIEGKGIEPDIKVEAFKPTEEEKEILLKLRESKLIEEFLIQYPYWEQADLTSLRSELEEEGITVEKELLPRFLRQEDQNKDNDILNDPQLLEAIEILGN